MFGNQTGQGKGTVRKSKKPAPAVQNIPVTLEQFYLGHTHLITINRQSFCRTCQNTGAKTKEICKGCNGQGTSSQTIQMGPAIMQVHSPCLECGTKGEKVIEICGACSGTGFTADKRVLSVRIQPGTKPSEKFVFPEVCSDDPSYESPGDIEIHLYEDPNDPTYKRFKRVGDRLQHLETVMEISLAESLLGCTVQLEGHPGYDEPIFLKIPAGSFTGDRYLVRELGMPIKGSQYGDLYLIIKVNVTAAERKKVSQEVVPLIEPLFQEGVRKTDSKEEVVHTELILQ
jgi:molecular chaperone DnaJ